MMTAKSGEAGILPELVTFQPKTIAEAAAMMRELAESGAGVTFTGGGTHTIGASAPEEVRISTLGLNRVLEYAPEDQTVTVEAGVTVAQLAAVLRECGQRLALDVADPDRSTLGGAIAANAFGPSRLRFGSLKDLILGVSVVRADGVVARAGGKVVKNVAGFDLSKFLVGSHGTLALITSATLRVHPLCEAGRALRIEALDAAAVWDAVLAMRSGHLVPLAAVAVRRSDLPRAPRSQNQDGRGTYDLEICFEGVKAGVEAQLATLSNAAEARGWQSSEVDSAAVLLADATVRSAGPLRVRGTSLPSEFDETEATIIAPLVETLTSARVNVYPALGIFTVAGGPSAATAATVLSCRGKIEARGGSLLVEAQAAGPNPIEPWGTPPASFPLMQQLKSRFDPQQRLSRGRFIGGI